MVPRPYLDPGAITILFRTVVNYVVTEYWMVNLKRKALRSSAKH
jgi:hypothetical protein